MLNQALGKLLCFFLMLISGCVFAQPTWTIDPFGKEKKPEKYEEKMLGSEKTASKNFTTFRKFVQNNVTHYNYFFNANNKLNAVIERAKLANQEDYSKLLPFYPYSTEVTSKDATELDSVIYKSTTGILIHDLRNEWVDDLYFLIGKAYYLKNDMDSAALTFQFINYNLFPRKKKNDDDDKVIGGNSQASAGILSIADKEKRNFFQKAFTKPASRNEALLWLTRTLIDKKAYGDAAGMINILSADPNLPGRLRNDLAEVTAYWFYEQDNYDSSAVYLEKALSAAENKQDKARWEFLLAQMLEMSGQFNKASEYYLKAARHTVNPLVDIYAHLNEAKMARTNGSTKELENALASLHKMAKKDKYDGYKDIIYFSIGQLSLQKQDTAAAIDAYITGIKKSTSPETKTKTFLQLANIAYHRKDYRNSFYYYDSVLLGGATPVTEFNIKERRDALANIVDKLLIIEREDSLQKIAAMPAAERDLFIKKLVKKIRKEQGLKDEEQAGNNASNLSFGTDKNEAGDLFTTAGKGEWYFYNASLKSKGFNEFKSRWGKRENVDNWRRAAAVASAISKGNAFADPMDLKNEEDSSSSKAGIVENSYDGLMQNLPLTSAALDSSNEKIANSMLAMAKVFQFEIQDLQAAITVLEQYLQRFPSRLQKGEVYLSLYYCYHKSGNEERANYYKGLLLSKFQGSNAWTKIAYPDLLKPNRKEPEIEAKYAKVYEQFIEGKFEQAKLAKVELDSLYGATYWSSQLLFIEAIYYVRQRQDSQAVVILNNLIEGSNDQKMKDKAQAIIDVLGRRKEIESYLTNLNVTRMEEDKVIIPSSAPVIQIQSQQPKSIEPRKIEMTNRPANIPDSIKSLPGTTSGLFKLQPEKAHTVVMLMDKVDPVYVTEAKNAFDRYNRQVNYAKSYTITKDALDPNRPMLLINSFTDADEALAYFEKIKKAAPSEISWLPAAKYSFIIISNDNLQLLRTNKDINGYKQLLNNNYGNKF